MRIAVFGTGAVGGYFGGRLAQAGEDVVFIARGDHLKAMLKRGLKVDSVNGDFLVKPVQATDDPAQVGIVDVVLVGVKAWQVQDAAEVIRPMVGPNTVAMPLQNGLEAPTQLAAVLGDQHVLGGLCGLSTFIVGPGHVRHAGADPFVRLGTGERGSGRGRGTELGRNPGRAVSVERRGCIQGKGKSQGIDRRD